jgi:hypothetical protein
MIHNIPKPTLSSQFTIDDIHKIREWNYERLKDSTIEEREAEYKERIHYFAKRSNCVFDEASNSYIHYPDK